MQQDEVEEIFENSKQTLLDGIVPTNTPFAYILGGQPASGKSNLLNTIKVPNVLVVNGDNYRVFHPEHQLLIKDYLNYSEKTQIFSAVFTERLIQEAIENKYNIIIEGTMRTPKVPLTTALNFRNHGFHVEAKIIAAHQLITEMEIYHRYQKEVTCKGVGRLSDINSHHNAVSGLLQSVDSLFIEKVVDKISIYSFLGSSKIQDYGLSNGAWSCSTLPSTLIVKERNNNLDKYLTAAIAKGEQTLSVIAPSLKNNVSSLLQQLENRLPIKDIHQKISTKSS